MTKEKAHCEKAESEQASGASSSGGAWALIGKLGTAVALVLGFFALYDKVFPNEASLAAKCTATEVQTRESGIDFDALRTELQDAVAPAALSSLLSGGVDLPVLESVSEELTKLMLVMIVGEHFNYASLGYLRCEVTNSGGRNAENIELRMPQEAIGMLADGKGENPSGKTVLPLGTMRPGTKSTLVLWFERPGYLFESEEEYVLTFDDGQGRFFISRPVFGLKADIVDFFETMGGVLVFYALALLFVVVISFSYLWQRIRGNARIQAAASSDSSSTEVPSEAQTN